MEKLIRDRADAKDVKAANDRVAAQLEPVVTALRAALDSIVSLTPEHSTTTPPVNPARSREMASHLTALLSELDPGAADFIEMNHAALRPLFDDGTWREFEGLVQGYDFDRAQTQLKQALESFAGPMKDTSA